MSRSNSSGSADRKETCCGTVQDGLKFVEMLQNFLVKQNEQIESLKTKVSGLEEERDFFIEKYQRLKATIGNLQTAEKGMQTEASITTEAHPSLDSASRNMADRSTEDDVMTSVNLLHKETETQEVQISISGSFSEESDIADGPPVSQTAGEPNVPDPNLSPNSQQDSTQEDGLVKRSITSPQSRLSKRGTHVTRQNSKGRVDMNYVLSPDLKAMTVELLANKYGGKEKANKAARIIQEYYRHWVFSKSFKRMRAYSEKRKRSISRPDARFAGRSIVYGHDNPVLIVDLENGNDENLENKTGDLDIEDDGNYQRTFSFDRKICNLNEKPRSGSINEEKRKRIMLPVDSVFYCGRLEENRVEKEVLVGSSTSNHINAREEENDLKVELEEKKDKSDVKTEVTLQRSESTDSYEIIDEKQVLQVIGRLNDQLGPGSTPSISSDPVEDSSLSENLSSSIFYDDERYPPTVDKSRKWRYRIGINLFNNKPEDGIEYLIDNELLDNQPKSIAEFLRKETSISKLKISEYFGKLRKETNRLVLQEFAQSFDFSGKEIDEALRQFQSYFKLTGEAQSIERFLQVFSERYVDCNPDGISTNVDTVLLLSFAMAMLNTDLHNGNVKRKMTMDAFVNNLRGTDDGKDFKAELLHNIYNRIQKNEFATGADHMTQLKQIEQSFIGKIPTIAVSQRQFVKLYTLEEIYDHNRQERPHVRLAFLFNDLLVLAKPRAKPGAHGGGHIFSHKATYELLGMQVAEFSNEYYKYGVFLQTKMDAKTVARFNLRDEKMRKSFTEELDDCIRETTGMNNIRIALSKSKQVSRPAYVGPQSMTLDRKKMKKKRTTYETTSLLGVDMNSLEAEDLSKARASSMLNISEAASDTESEPSMRRSTSSNSLESTDSRNTLPRLNDKSFQKSPSGFPRKGFFGFTLRRKTSIDKTSSTSSLEKMEKRREVGMSTFFGQEDDIDESET